MADSIKCPNCKSEIPLEEVIAHQIDEELAAKLAAKETEFAARETELQEAAAAREKELTEAAAEREREITTAAEERVTALRSEFEQAQTARETEVQQRAEKKAEENVAVKLADLGAQLEEQGEQLRESRERELEFLGEKRKLDQDREHLDLEIARRLSDERAQIAAEARKTADEEHGLAMREKEIEFKEMQQQIRELKDATAQRPGLIGEAQEQGIEDVLNGKFRRDKIEPVKSGVRGADVLQSVFSPRGDCCGKILIESKRAQNWSNGWIPKLKEDQARAGADVAVLVCSPLALPEHVETMDIVDGVWVVGYGYVACLVQALREGLIGIARARVIDMNRNDSMEAIYTYLTSNEFGRRVRTMVDTFVEMNTDLDSEERAAERIFKKRRKQLSKLELNTAGMYGELEALVGPSLPAIETLELPAAIPLRTAS